MSLATHGVQARDAGVASAMVNTSQQVGGAIGTALLNTIAASATTAYATSHAAGARSADLLKLQSMVHGYSTAIWWAVGILALAAVIAFTLVNTGRPGGGSPTASSADGEGAAEGEAEEVHIPVMAH
jgi:hypothetical protein